MKKLLIFVLVFLALSLSAEDKKNIITNKILLNIENKEPYFEFILTNISNKDFVTTDLTINNNYIVLIDSNGEKMKVTSNKDGAKQVVVKVGESLRTKFTFPDLIQLFNSFKKINKGEVKLVWDCEGELSNEILLVF